MIKEGALVTRYSYNNDVIFKIEKIDNNIAYLVGVDFRLTADASINDLCIVESYDNKNEDKEYLRKLQDDTNLDRDEYFYLPGKILHIDSDKNYLDRCLEFYKNAGVLAYGIKLQEKELGQKVLSYLKEIKPDILVMTGHDSYNKKKEEYKNSKYFCDGIKSARKFENSYDSLVIIAGACQSNYEELIKSGATFASSPKRINIHALDPAIIATTISLSERGKIVNLINLLNKTKYGKDGIGGLITNGMMFVGYPRA